MSTDAESEFIAGEVKKTTRETSKLIANLRDPEDRNSHNKLIGLLRRHAPYFWVVGPDMQSSLFRVEYQPDDQLVLTEVDVGALRDLTAEKFGSARTFG